MLPAALNIPVIAARRFLLRALRLDVPAPTMAEALAHLGYIQIDPINVCGRMHDLIARNRVAGYREGDLMRHLHGEGAPLAAGQRVAFEHHLPSSAVLVALTLDAWPHLRAAMHARTKRTSAWSGRLSPRERELAERILGEMAERGPLNSETISDGRRATPVWGRATLAKAVLQKLFFHGRVLLAGRDGNRRLYDLPERVLPDAVRHAPEPSREETARWQALLKLRQRRLATLKRDELPLVEDRVQAVRVPGCPVLYCLREDTPLFDAVAAGEAARASGEPRAAVTLLAPLDPLIYDRAVTSRLWDFDYTWEVYTPAHRRVRGYYALPVLAGTEIVGHVDPKADRRTGTLAVMARRVRRGHAVGDAVRDLAAFLGLRAK